MSVSASQQVSWSETRRFLEAILTQANVGPLPWAGTPEWCELPAGDPRKLLALALAGEHHVLRVEVAQTAQADAGRSISAAVDWSAVARANLRHADAVRSGVHIPREVA